MSCAEILPSASMANTVLPPTTGETTSWKLKSLPSPALTDCLDSRLPGSSTLPDLPAAPPPCCGQSALVSATGTSIGTADSAASGCSCDVLVSTATRSPGTCSIDFFGPPIHDGR